MATQAGFGKGGNSGFGNSGNWGRGNSSSGTGGNSCFGKVGMAGAILVWEVKGTLAHLKGREAITLLPLKWWQSNDEYRKYNRWVMVISILGNSELIALRADSING